MIESESTVRRPPWPEYFMAMAHAASARATCPRRAVGALLVSTDNRILTTGYNGSPSGWPDCLSDGCLMINNHCERTIHAELNTVITAAKHGVSTQHSTLYVSGASPCHRCALLIAQAGIERVVFDVDYTNDTGIQLLQAHGVEVIRLSTEPNL